jgi:thioredoxin 1
MAEVHRAFVLRVNEFNFAEEVRGSSLPVLIDVSAPWCAPCRAAAPVVSELARRHSGALKVVEVDGGESPALVTELGVRGFPTFVALLGGEVVERRAGFAGAKALEAMIARLLERSTQLGPKAGLEHSSPRCP